MLVIESRVDVAGLTGRYVTDFMVACTDEQYRKWWPGTHLQFHALGQASGGVGDVVVMDEFVGWRRLRRPAAGPAAAAAVLHAPVHC